MAEKTEKKKDNLLTRELRNELPGVTVSLPTWGQYYDKGTIREGVDPKQLQVHPYSIWDEVRFRDPYKIAAGVAMQEMLKRVCPDILRPEDMATVDVEAVMVASKMASYGAMDEFEIECSNKECRARSSAKVDLYKLIAQYSYVGAPEEHRVLLPNKQHVQVMPIRYMATLGMMKLIMQKHRKFTGEDLQIRADLSDEETEKLVDETVTAGMELMKDCVAWVAMRDGTIVRDRGMISEWMDALPASWTEQITDAMNAMADRTKNAGTIRFECPSCKAVQENLSIVSDPSRFFGQSSRTSGRRRPSASSKASASTA